MFRNVLAPSPNMGEGQPIFIGVGNHPDDPSKLSIGMNDTGKIFIGIMAKAILDSLTAEFEGLLSGEIGNEVLDKKVKQTVSEYLFTKGFKICPSCKNENLPNAKYCDQCRKEL